MINKFKKFIKLIVFPTVLATVLAVVLSYFILGIGIPVAHGLKESDVASVKIAQAVNLAKILSFRFGKAGEESADTSYIFALKDGSKIEIGANSDTIFKNGKIYLGVKDSCVLFGKCTQAIFSFETPPDGRAEKKPAPSLNELLTTELTADLESIGVDTKVLTKLEIIDPTV